MAPRNTAGQAAKTLRRKEIKGCRPKMQSLPAVGRGQRKKSLRLCAFARIEKITHKQSKNISTRRRQGAKKKRADPRRR